MSTSLTYLAGALGRPNLTVQGGAVADRFQVRGGAATGCVWPAARSWRLTVWSWRPGAMPVRPSSCGRASGPAGQLSGLGVDVVADLPGVGENLIDHPLVAVDLPTPPGGGGPRFQAIATLRSQLAPAAGPDLHLFAAGPWDVSRDASPAGAVFGLVAGLVLPLSRGWVRLRSADPADPPRIDVAHLRHRDDRRRMIEATLIARAISRTAPLAGLVEGAELAPGPTAGDDEAEAIAASIASRVSTYHHPVGTGRMGADPDGGAVVDARGRAHGIEQLHVADPSMPQPTPTCRLTGTRRGTAAHLEHRVANSAGSGGGGEVDGVGRVGKGLGERAVDWAYLLEPYARRANDALFDRAGVGLGTRLLDIACGSGYAAGRGAEVAGLDASEALIAIARARTPGADFRVGDMFALPFEDDRFDVATSFNGIWKGCEDALRQACRVVRPGGLVGFSFWGSPKRLGLLPFFAAMLELSPPGHVDATLNQGDTGRPGVAEQMLTDAGLEFVDRGTAQVVNEWPDLDLAVRALASGGPAWPAVQWVGYDRFAEAIRQAIRPL